MKTWRGKSKGGGWRVLDSQCKGKKLGDTLCKFVGQAKKKPEGGGGGGGVCGGGGPRQSKNIEGGTSNRQGLVWLGGSLSELHLKRSLATHFNQREKKRCKL